VPERIIETVNKLDATAWNERSKYHKNWKQFEESRLSLPISTNVPWWKSNYREKKIVMLRPNKT